MKIKYKPLIISLLITYAVAFIGSLFTSPNTSTSWYQSIKPAITPPNFVFPIVWNILFLLIAISLYLVIINSKKKEKKNIYLLFGLNFVLNILWSVIFFGFKKPLWAFVEIIFLWQSILALIIETKKINKTSSYLLWPYIAWVTFATFLNILIAF